MYYMIQFDARISKFYIIAENSRCLVKAFGKVVKSSGFGFRMEFDRVEEARAWANKKGLIEVIDA